MKSLAIAAFLACLPVAAQAATDGGKERCAPAAAGADSFCSINGVRIHYVDWGGTGPTIILLSGLGDSARIFDDLAPRLAHRHRVIAVTRRGYGLSDHSQTDYSNPALVGDILGLMDALDISKASFVGHSIAGGELSMLGAHYSKRVERLVYLDSAYDRTRALELTNNVPKTAAPTAADMGSIEAIVRWREAVLGTHSPAVRENVIDTTQKGLAGFTPATPTSVMLSVLAGDVAAKPDYRAIAAPALALYSSKDVAEQIPPGTSPEVRQHVADYETHRIRPWMLRAQADFLEQKTCGVTAELPHSTHYFFLTSAEWTARAILEYLAADDPCRWSPVDLPASK